MLITFLISCYRKIMNFLLKISFYAAPIIIGLVSAVSSYAVKHSVWAVLGGFVVGAVFGFIGAVVAAFIVIPPVLVLFEINENLVKIHKEIKKDEELGNSESASSKKNKNDLEKFPVNEIKKQEITDERIAEAQKHGCWICSKCGEENPNMREICSNCGTEK